VNSSPHGAIQVSALRLLIKLLWVEVINAPPVGSPECFEEDARATPRCAIG